MRGGVPVVEAADDVNVAGIGRPDAEDGACGALGLDQMRAQFVVDAIVAAFVEQE